MKTMIFCALLIIPGASLDQGAAVSNTDFQLDTIQEEYMTIVITGFFINTQKVYISQNGEEFEKISVSSKGDYNYNEAIKIMRKYNEEGWVISSSNLSFDGDDSDHLFVFMTRKKNHVATKSESFNIDK